MDSAVTAWCERTLDAGPVEVLFRAGYLSEVTGVRLGDGRTVVLKARPTAARIAGCVAVQRALADAGFPCPRPLAGPGRVGDVTVTAEEYRPGGEQLPSRADSAELFARLLADLVGLAPPVDAVPPIGSSPPWVGWDAQGPDTWPPPDDLDVELNDHPGPAWLDDLGRAVRERLAGHGLPLVIGHGDFESQNVRWRDRRAWAVHDWDSVIAEPEAAIAGAAGAVWPAAGEPGQAATVNQSDRFLAAYERARREPWSRSEREIAWAAGLWVRAFNAKKDAVSGGPGVDMLAAEVADRTARAGL